MGAPEICENTDELQDINDKDTRIQNILKNSFNNGNIESRLKETDQKIPISSSLSEIGENLMLTSATFVHPQTIDQYGISCIISCAPELPDPPLIQDHVIYYKINILDNGSSRILQYFDSTADLIHQICNLGGKTLVFCVAGVSRSATICIAYLMKYNRIPLLQAYNLVKDCRPRIKPNCGFFRQLIDYEKVLFGCNSVQMIYNENVRMEIPDVYDFTYRNPMLMINPRKSNV